eukprot:m.224790 g.224790  ORF g.224790 m.224790 type:complete len:654 (+) comp16545_c0_seq1:57-2018(+)
MPPKRKAASKKAEEPAEEPQAMATDQEDFSSMKVAELREACKAKGLDTTGTKAVLVARLEAGASGAAPAAAAPAAAPAAAEEEEAAPKRARRGKAAAPAAPAPAAAEEEEAAPAKKGRAAKGKGKAAAAAKKEEEAEEEEAAPAAASKSGKMAALAAQKSSKLRPNAPVDALVPGAGSFKVYSSATETFDVMLNQTNIGQNNNKYYVIQLLERGGTYWTWNRWGRVGEPGQNKLQSHGFSLPSAISDFEKKFKDKTSNAWGARDNFQKRQGKYDMVDMADAEEEEKPKKKVQADGKAVKQKPLQLDDTTAKLVKLLFDHDMFKEAMSNLQIDVEKMPLGKISKSQIAKGYEVLEEMKEIVSSGKSAGLADLSSRFYTIIPHNFGRSIPPVIRTLEDVQRKMEMLEVLGDIELALGLQKKDEDDTDGLEEVPHPIDQNYASLHCGLRVVDRASREFQVIQKYLDNTMEGRDLKLQEVWAVDRHGEAERFAAHDDIKERKLLWHGTNVAVVAAILKSGLRIMPHSGGRVGKGIYLASENAKSACYVRTVREGSVPTGIMFLAEAALGKEHHITMDDCRLTHAPKGYDSIVAKGSGEPDPSKDTTITLDGRPVVVPQGKRIPQPEFSGSNFDKSEYLIYKESQHRIRYLLKLKFPW